MSETRFYTPQEAEAAFYAAFMKHDVNAMMAVWGGDEKITCIHPLGPVLTGREAIRDAWAAIFRNAPDMQVIITELSRMQEGELAIHVVEAPCPRCITFPPANTKRCAAVFLRYTP